MDEKPLIETSYFVDPAGAMLALVGWERWGDEWLDLLRSQGTPRPIRINDSPFGPWQNLLWVAQNPPHPGRWLVGETPVHAEIGGLGEDLGYSVVSDIFRERVARGEGNP